MPIDRTSVPPKSDALSTIGPSSAFACCWRKREMIGVEQSRVHHMQRQFEQPTRIERLVHLRCASAISHRLVVANRRVVSRASSLQHRGRLLVIVKPVHPHADFGELPSAFESLPIPRALCSCRAMHRFRAAPLRSPRRSASGSHRRYPEHHSERRESRVPDLRDLFPGWPLNGITKKVECKALFQFQITIVEFAPEIFRQAEVHKRKLQSRRPIPDQISEWTFARERVFAKNQKSRDTRNRTSCDPICVGGSKDDPHRASGKR